MKKTCELCGKEFETNLPHKKYCSLECYHEAHLISESLRRRQNGARALEVKECAFCGKEFQQRASNQKYCSIECSNKAQNKRHVFGLVTPCKVVQCAFCGKEFQQKVPHQKYCSENCRAAAYTPRTGKVKFDKKICPVCGKEFEPHHVNQIYCNAGCQERRAKERAKEWRRDVLKKLEFTRVCKVCGKEFVTNGPDVSHCSRKCADVSRVQVKRQAEIKRVLKADEAHLSAKKRQAQLDQRIREADELGLSYGYYVAKLSAGATFEELKEKMRNEKSVDGDSDFAF